MFVEFLKIFSDIYFGTRCPKIMPERFWAISIHNVLNCFKYFQIYILEQNVSKSDKKDFEVYKVFTLNSLYQNDKMFQVYRVLV